MNSHHHPPSPHVARLDSRIPGEIVKLSSLAAKLEATNDADQRAAFVQDMHRAATLLDLLIQSECRCQDEPPGDAFGRSECESEAFAAACGYSDSDREEDCPFTRIVQAVRSDHRRESGSGPTESLSHLLALARAGRRPGCSDAERQSRRLVVCILDNAVGIDQRATSGIAELIDLVQANPMSGRDAVREAIR